MFFTPELLMIRKKGKFAKCWLAANFSRSSFFKKYRPKTVAEINVAKTCKQIIASVVSEDSNKKLSLYLSANLMLGTTRILQYQVEMCLQQQFDLQRKIIIQLNPNDLIDEKQKRIKDLPIEDLFLIPDVPMAALNFSANLANEAAITLTELSINQLYETTMQAVDQLNFGALTDQQLGGMLENDGLPLLSPSSVRFLHSPETSLPAIEAVPEPHVFKVPDVREKRGKSRNGTEAVDEIPGANGPSIDIQALPEAIEGFSTIQIVRPPGTPTKHKLSPPSNVGTPSKRRNLMIEINSELAQVPIPVEPPTAVQAGTAAPSNDSMNLDSLNESLLEVLNKPKKRIRRSRTVVDRRKQLPMEELRSVAEDLLYRTRASSALGDIITLPLASAGKLLTTPSTKKPWANSLLANYQMTILEPISEPRMDRKARRQQRSLIRKEKSYLPREKVREPIDTSAQERSGELSDKQLRQNGVSSDDVSSKDRTNTLDHISIAGSSTSRIGLPRFVESTDQVPGQTIPNFSEDIPLPNVVLEQEDLLEAPAAESLTNIPENVHNIINDWTENGQTIRTANRSTREKIHAVDVSSITSAEDRAPERHQISWSSATSHPSAMSPAILDLIGQLESLWTDRPVIEFKELCPVDKSTRKDAARMFMHLLELNRIKEVKLTQAEPFGPIYIQKYSPYF